MRMTGRLMAQANPLIPHAVVQRISRRYIAASSLEEGLGVADDTMTRSRSFSTSMKARSATGT
jgi:hypothetical protein